jgi:CTP:molybdopterin cytidylyltransferase MocA
MKTQKDPFPLHPPALRVGAVLLAAGSASRMGGRPKCLLQWDGQSLIVRQIGAWRAAGITDIVVVLGHYAPAIAAVLHGLAVQVVHNPHPEEGQASSLRIGLQASAQAFPRAKGYLIGLADQPLITALDITALLQAHQHRPAGCTFTQAQVAGQPGNPVVFTPEVRDALLAASGEWGGRQWQQAHPEQVYRWPCDNEHYTMDLDSPEDVQAFTLRTGRDLVWPAPGGTP